MSAGKTDTRDRCGYVQIYTGEGKGKTTAALGLILRSWGHEHKAILLQFMKSGPSWGEIVALSRDEQAVTIATIDIPAAPSKANRDEQQRGFLKWRAPEMKKRYDRTQKAYKKQGIKKAKDI